MCSLRRFSVRFRDARAMYRLQAWVIRMLRVLLLRSSLNRATKKLWFIAAVSTLVGAAAFLFAQAPATPLRFVILGDRTGETVAGVYEAVWKEIAAVRPAFVVGVGDSIQGLDDGSAEKAWLEFAKILEPF